MAYSIGSTPPMPCRENITTKPSSADPTQGDESDPLTIAGRNIFNAEEACHWEILNDDCLLEIFMRLPTKDLLSCLKLNRRCRALIKENPILKGTGFYNALRSPPSLKAFSKDKYEKTQRTRLKALRPEDDKQMKQILDSLAPLKSTSQFPKALFYRISKTLQATPTLTLQKTGSLSDETSTNDRLQGNHCFHPDGSLFVAATTTTHQKAARLFLFDENGKPCCKGQISHNNNEVTSVCLSHSGRMILTTASTDCTARLTLIDARYQLPQIGEIIHGDIVNTACFSPNDKMILTASNDHTAKITSIEKEYSLIRLLQLITHTSPVTDAKFSPNGQIVLTSTSNQHVWLSALNYRNHTEPDMKQLRGFCPPPNNLNLATFSFDSRRILTREQDNHFLTITNGEGKVLNQKGSFQVISTKVSNAIFSPDASFILIGTTGKILIIRTCDVENEHLSLPTYHADLVNAAVPIKSISTGSAHVKTINFSPDESTFLVSTTGKTYLGHINHAGNPEIRPINNPYTFAAMSQITFSPDMHLILETSIRDFSFYRLVAKFSPRLADSHTPGSPSTRILTVS